MKLLYFRPRNADGSPVDKGGMALAVKQRPSDGRLLVAISKCAYYKLFDEKHNCRQAAARLNAGQYRVMRLEILARFIGLPAKAVNMLLAADTSVQT
jgi:hypothetical protein